MFHLGHQDLPAIESRLLGGDPVQGVGRALDEDDHLVLLINTEKPCNQLACLFVGLGGEP